MLSGGSKNSPNFPFPKGNAWTTSPLARNSFKRILNVLQYRVQARCVWRRQRSGEASPEGPLTGVFFHLGRRVMRVGVSPDEEVPDTAEDIAYRDEKIGGRPNNRSTTVIRC